MGAVLVRHEPTSARLVRRQLTRELLDLGISPSSIEEVVLVASELVGNAVRHALPPVDGHLDVSWTLDAGGVIVAVADGSPVPPRRRAAHLDEASGRGLTIVEALAERWGSEQTDTGKRVWARVPVTRQSSLS